MTVESKNKPSVSEALARCCFGESENNLGESGGSLQGCAPAFCIKTFLSTDFIPYICPVELCMRWNISKCLEMFLIVT